MKEELLPLLPRPGMRKMRYFTYGSLNSAKQGRICLDISFKDLNKKFNEDQYFPMDGEIIKAFDQLSAFIEAKLSIKHGVSSDALLEAESNIYNLMKDSKVSGIDFGRIFRYFSS